MEISKNCLKWKNLKSIFNFTKERKMSCTDQDLPRLVVSSWFKSIDSDKDGRISLHDFDRFLTSFGITEGIEAGFAFYDLDHDTYLSEEEFYQWWSHPKKRFENFINGKLDAAKSYYDEYVKNYHLQPNIRLYGIESSRLLTFHEFIKWLNWPCFDPNNSS